MHNDLKERDKAVNWHPYTQMKTATDIIPIVRGQGAYLFDDKGICYGFKLRKGNTYSAVDAPEMLYNAMKIIPKDIKKQFRADSAYSNSEVYNVCLNKNCNFVICLKENVWSSVLAKNRRHIKWQKTRLQFFDSDKCEIGSCLYPLKGLAGGREFLRVVFIRTQRLNPTKE